MVDNGRSPVSSHRAVFIDCKNTCISQGRQNNANSYWEVGHGQARGESPPGSQKLRVDPATLSYTSKGTYNDPIVFPSSQLDESTHSIVSHDAIEASSLPLSVMYGSPVESRASSPCLSVSSMSELELQDTLDSGNVPPFGALSPYSPDQPSSAGTWTEYMSPLFNRNVPFIVDTCSSNHILTSPKPSEEAAAAEQQSQSPHRLLSQEPTPTSPEQQAHEAVQMEGHMLPPNTINPDAPAAPIQLSHEQKQVLDRVKSGKNVFFTGPAGTGKSVLLGEIINYFLREKGYTRETLAITASTGIAGLHIGGSTVHSFVGLGLAKESAKSLAARVWRSDKLRQRWQGVKTLIVDEISMLDGVFFDKLEYIARSLRCKPGPGDIPLSEWTPPQYPPFGGIQLVLSGDFFQLPPVPDQCSSGIIPATYAFDANSWSACIGTPVVLRQVFRQRDNNFARMLSMMRLGKVDDELIREFHALSRPIEYADGIEPSCLFPLKNEVESHNTSRLRALNDPTHTYIAMDSRGYDFQSPPQIIPKEMAKILLNRMVAQREINIKVGAQVMLIKNIIKGRLVNGSTGKVIEFLTTHQARQRHIEIATPLHNAEQSDKESPPQVSTAEFVPMDDVVFDNKQFWPLVQFTNGMLLLCAPLDFTVDGLTGKAEVCRLQVPLILAWALSIHKSQGQTLERVKVDLGRIFEKGQAYVALSRATTMESLEIQNFHPSKVMAHPRVLDWQASWIKRLDIPADDEMDCEEAVERSRLLWA